MSVRLKTRTKDLVISTPFQRSRPGHFYRGNLHAHSTNSDGGKSPSEVVAAYRQQGYDFCAVTDHFLVAYDYPITDTAAYRQPEFTTIIGAELHAPALENGQDWHILGLGLPGDFAPPLSDETGPMLAERACAAGAFVGLAHPAWYGATIADLQSVPTAHAVEVYNEVCANLSDRAESWYVTDALLSSGRKVTAFAADDAHFFRPGARSEEHFLEEMPSAFKAWVWVRADSLDPGSLVAALKAGEYYSSQGPLIHDVSIDGGRKTLSVSCSPASSIIVAGCPAVFATTSRHGTALTGAILSIEPYDGSYCRVTVVDDAGKRAWSNPIWLP